MYLPYISEQEGVFNRFYALLGALTLTLTLTLSLSLSLTLSLTLTKPN